MRPGKKRREAAVAPSRRPTNRKPESRLETRANSDAVAAYDRSTSIGEESRFRN